MFNGYQYYGDHCQNREYELCWGTQKDSYVSVQTAFFILFLFWFAVYVDVPIFASLHTSGIFRKQHVQGHAYQLWLTQQRWVLP